MKQVCQVKFNAEAKEYLKTITREFLTKFLKHLVVHNKGSLSEEDMTHVVKGLILPRKSVFGERMRRDCCKKPPEIDLHFEVAPFKRLVEELAEGKVKTDREGLQVRLIIAHEMLKQRVTWLSPKRGVL